MKKWSIRSYLAGIVTSVLILGLCVPAIAATIQKQMTATYKDIKIYVDGQKVTPKDANGNIVEPFVSNGTTYLPVRAVGEAFGKTVEWDGATNSVYIGEKPGNTAYSRTNPAPLNTAQTISVSKYSGDYSVTIKITDAFRGQTAWAKIKEANMFNEPAPSGKEYILFAVSATVNSTSDGKSVSFSDFDFTAFSSSNAEYDRASVVVPDPEFSGSAYEGATVEGWVVVMVDADDEAPKVVYGENYDGTGGIWFSLK